MLKRWNESEPVRLWLYGLAVPVVGLLGVYGLVTQQEAAAWLLVVAAALVPTAEGIRARVSPAASSDHAPEHRA